MRDSSEFDEAEEDVSDRLFSLDEILSESEVEEVKSGEGKISEEERDELLQEIHSDILSEGERDELVRDSISKVKVRDIERGIDPEEVCRLYTEEGLSLSKIGEHYGFKTGKPIKRILETAGVEIRQVGFQKIEIDPEEVHRLYFEEHWQLNEIVEHYGCKSTDPIHRVFREQGWKTLHQETYEKEIDPDEVFRLYDEGMSMRKIGEHYGVSYGPILRIFEKHDREYGREIQIDPEIIHRLYFGEGLSRDEVCERFGVSRKVIDRIFVEQEWEKRPAGFQPVEIDIDDFKRLYYEEELELEEMAERLQVSIRTIIRFREEQGLEDRVLKYGTELRDEIFGTECRLCGKPYEHVHRKDGTPHKSHILWSRKSLLKLDPDAWAALCEPCHRVTHSLMRAYGFEWDHIEEKVRGILGRKSLLGKFTDALSKWF